MWTPLIRSQIQFYLSNGITAFEYFAYYDEFDPVKVCQFIIWIAFPVASFIIIQKFKNELNKGSMKIRYGPLYQNNNISRDIPEIMIILFFIHRVMLALCTGIT